MAEPIDPGKLLECNVVDCRPPAAEGRPAAPRPVLAADYLAKDYDSLLRAMLDLIPTRAPGWRDRTEADLGIALAELLAYVGDQLSYYQDRVANEAYLRSATQYDSVRRLLRLLDYIIDPGSAAQVILSVQTNAAAFVAAGFQVRTKSAPGAKAAVFETAEEKVFDPSLNQILLHQDAPSSAERTQAVLQGEFEGLLQAGSWILFEGPLRLEWAALATPPVVDSVNHATTVTLTGPLQGDYAAATSRVRGNGVQATHGQTMTAEAAGTGLPGQTLALEFPSVTFTGGSDGAPRSSLEVSVDGAAWKPVEDFIDSGSADTHYRVAQDNAGYQTILFGDNRQGQAPAEGVRIQAKYRVGCGEAGLVGAGTLTEYFDPNGHIVSVTNPLPSFGAREPQSLAEAKLSGPRHIRRQNRAVAPADYEEVLAQGVRAGAKIVKPLQAKARFANTGSWTTVVVSVDMPDRKPLAATPGLRSPLEAALAAKKLAGCDVRVEDARYAPLYIALAVSVKPDYFARLIREEIRWRLGSTSLPDGAVAFFAPGRFAFGQDVHLSDLYAVAMAVEGVQSLSVTRFKRLGASHPDRRQQGFVPIGALEIARCDGDPSNPQNGILYVRTLGGKEG